jgi:nucleotidyltransferase substrate binding protein (TIGR01987 family)
MNLEDKLDISDLVNCADNFYKTLKRALLIEAHDPNITYFEGEDYEFVYRFSRAAAIHMFEITVENAWKMMQRWIKINVDRQIHEKPKRELFRTAHQSGLISDPVVWWEFYDGRNKTSHTYHEEVAEEVYRLAKKFDVPLKEFIERLEVRR